MQKAETLMIGIIILSFVIGAYLYPQMPEKIASHWNAEGKVNGYLPKFWGLFLMPLVSLGLFLLFLAIPKIDPMKANIEKFKNYYDGFVALFIAFLFYLNLLVISSNLGFEFNIIQALSPAFGILFYYCGILVENAKQNWFIGIRTPWTLSSERVWNKTHRIGGRLFKIAGAVAAVGIFSPGFAPFLVIVPVILIAAYTFVYSYLEYQRGKE